MNFEDVVAGVEGAEPLPGMREAWRWSPMPRFVFSLALDSKHNSAYQMNTIDHFDQGLVTAVLEFAKERRLAGEMKDSTPFTVAPGFTTESYGFDVVVAVPPAVHQYHFGWDNALGERVTGVFPAYSCEFSGRETLEEAVYRFKRMLRPTVVERPVAPYLRMRYENTRTGSGSLGALRGFTTTDVLLRELALLEGTVGSFVEWENFRGEVWHVTWDGSWLVNGGVRSEPMSESAVLSTLGCPESS
ncbi:hypothetical protein [Streptomyces mirabilis]|uniref:hypothetical protein n=1 Tax=Streptomyces mirabilis TaxID=68239 RepID=UPI00224DC916|nr:hypothetical protein [Streptomyces mirabilis]MCX4609674.1 hypothetical protein [Streptomyces mirabilis]